MGGDLLASGEAAPSFLVWAMSDPLAAPLQRVQVVKGWLYDHTTYETVYDVACSDGLTGPSDPSLWGQRRQCGYRDLRHQRVLRR